MSVAVKVDERHPNDELLIPLEDDMTAAVAAELERVARALTRGVTADTVQQVTQRAQSAETWQGLRDVLADWLRKMAEAGVDVAQGQINRDIYGVKDIETALVAAALWAARYADDLMGMIRSNRVTAIAALVAAWLANGEPVAKLRDDIRTHRLFGETTARTIAVTETIRSFERGKIIAYDDLPDIETNKRWNTANDELVCPICGPLHNVVIARGAQFQTANGAIDEPPAHPRCRCWLTFPTVDQGDVRPTGLAAPVGQRQPPGIRT